MADANNPRTWRSATKPEPEVDWQWRAHIAKEEREAKFKELRSMLMGQVWSEQQAAELNQIIKEGTRYSIDG